MSAVVPADTEPTTTITTAFPTEVGQTTAIRSTAGRRRVPVGIPVQKRQVIPSLMETGRLYHPVSTAVASLVPVATLVRKQHHTVSPTGIGHMLQPPATAEAGLALAAIRPPKRRSIPSPTANGQPTTPSIGGRIPALVAIPRRNPRAMQTPMETVTVTLAATSWQGFP